jgi:dTMP kinase
VTLSHHLLGRGSPPSGWFVAFEGGEGAGKSTQVLRLAEWLRGQGREVVVTYEPGDTPVGVALRRLLLAHDAGPLAPRAEALLFAADRAQHVAHVVRPALARGAVVISDRYVDSSLAYQGAGRALPVDEVAQLSAWASDGLVPDLTIVLDLPAAVGLARLTDEADQMEAQPLEFHERVRAGFLELAADDPQRYLVVDATADADAVHAAIRQHLVEVAV